MKQAKQQIGIRYDEITTVMVGGQSGFGQHPIAAIRTSKSYTADQIIDNMNQKGQTSTVTEGGHTIHRKNIGNDAFCVVNGNLILFGDLEGIKGVLKRNGAPKLSSYLQSAVNSTSFGSTIAVAGGGPTKGGGMGGGMPGFDPSKAEYFYADVNFGSTISVRGTVSFKDSQTASDTQKALDGIIAMGKNAAPAGVKDILNTVSISASGQRLTAAASIDPAKAKELAAGGMGGMNPLAGLLGGGGKPGFPPVNPPVNPPIGINPAPGTVNPPYSTTVNFQPNQIVNYKVNAKQGQALTVYVVPQFDTKVFITVRFNGQIVTQDVNNTVRKDVSLTWAPAAAGVFDVEINHVDNLTNNCAVAVFFAGSPPPPRPIGGVAPPPPPTGGGGTPILNANGQIFNGGQKDHFIALQAGSTYTIKMSSAQVDSYLELYSPTGQKVAFDDDGDGFPNARIIYVAPQSGNYRIVCRTFGNQGTGGYNLTVLKK